jgi:putative transposase
MAPKINISIPKTAKDKDKECLTNTSKRAFVFAISSKAFDIEIDKDVVRRVLAKHYTPASSGSGPSWLTVIGHVKDSLWSIDLFCCESILLKTHWVMVVMDQHTRRIIGFGVQVGYVDGVSICRMFNQAVARRVTPKYLSTDNSPLFRSHQWQANLRVLEVTEIKTVPYVPLSHPFVERLIGTIRREYLNHVLFWNSVDLERKLREFMVYYNESRVHSSLEGDTPAEIAGRGPGQTASLTNFRWKKYCNGLFQLPVAA